MFRIEGDSLILSWEMTLDEVKSLKEFLTSRLEFIDSIAFEKEGEPKSSALIALLFSAKKSKPELSIPALESEMIHFGRVGDMGWRV